MGQLRGLSEEVIDTPIEHQTTDPPNRNLFLWNEFGRIEDIKSKLISERFVKEL